MILWIAVIIGVIGVDQLTKFLAVKFLEGRESLSVIGEILHFNYVENTGMAFGMLKNQRWIFISVSCIAIIAIIVLLIKYKPKSKFLLIAAAFIAGGGIGNMIDRVFFGYVVDFIYIKIINFAVFNAADSFVCVGTVMLLIYLLFFPNDFFGSEKKDKIQK